MAAFRLPSGVSMVTCFAAPGWVHPAQEFLVVAVSDWLIHEHSGAASPCVGLLAVRRRPAYSAAMIAAVPRVKPKLRGVFHELGFYAAIALGVPLVLTADPGRARIAAIAFASCLAGCFGASMLVFTCSSRGRIRRSACS